MKKLIKVTQDDIKNGTKRISESCPIALALKRKFKINYAFVRYSFFKLEDGITHPMPEKACNFAEDFDRGKKVKPFSFYTILNMYIVVIIIGFFIFGCHSEKKKYKNSKTICGDNKYSYKSYKPQYGRK
jgi:hypothetical protein